MDILEREIEVAEEAARWAAIRDADNRSNYDVFVSSLNQIRLAYPHCTFLYSDKIRERVEALKAELIANRGMERRYYPVLIRWALMDFPQLAAVDAPRHPGTLDCQKGQAHVQRLFLGVALRKPAVRSWQLIEGES